MLLKFSIQSNICELVYFISALEICQLVNVAKSCLQTTEVMYKVTKILQLISFSIQNLDAWLSLKENPPLSSNSYCSVFFQRILKLYSGLYSPVQLQIHGVCQRQPTNRPVVQFSCLYSLDSLCEQVLLLLASHMAPIDVPQ